MRNLIVKHKSLTLLVILITALTLLSLPSCAKSIVDENSETRDKVTDLELTVATQSELLANLASIARISTVELTGSFVKSTVSGEGDYPVIFTLYGTGLKKGYLLSNKENAKIAREYIYSNGEVLVVIVEPIGRWLGVDTAEIKLNNLIEVGGKIKYASATYGTVNISETE